MFTKIPKTSISNIAFRLLPTVRDDMPQKDIPQQLKPWEKFDWPKEKEQAMYLEWGVHCSRKQKPDRAENYYERAIDLKESDANALYHLSRCQRQVAKTKIAFENCKKAQIYDSHNPRIDREFCRCLYQLNEFEIAKAKSCTISGKYTGSQSRSFKMLAETFDSHIKDCFGQPFSEFMVKRQHILPHILSDHQKTHILDPRPLWKILKEQKKCDVVSVLEKEIEKLHPREIARRKLASKVFHQVYLPNSWKDALYQRDLEHGDEYFSSVFKDSTPILRKLLKTKNEAVNNFLKMLHARSPLYNEFNYKLRNKDLSDLMREKHLNRVQYATRRNMFNILRKIKDLRSKGAIKKLAEFVEKSMGDYITVKTKRIAPWKQDFLHEVYNTLALAFTDKFVIPPGIMESTDIYALENLFNIEPAKETITPIGFVFGNKATQIDLTSFNLAHERKRKFLDRMENRLFFATESIEKAYIYHEMARAHYKTSNFGECEYAANKGVKEASQSGNTIWAFLCMMLIVKTHISTARREKCADALEAAGNFAFALQCWPLVDFLDLAKYFNYVKIIRVKSVELSDSRKSKSRSIESSDQNSAKMKPEEVVENV